MRRMLGAVALGLLVAALSGGLWLAWAEMEYRGLDSCPFDVPGHGHPALIALGLMAASAVIMFLRRWGQVSRQRSALLAIATAFLTGTVIYVIAILVGAGLRCFD